MQNVKELPSCLSLQEISFFFFLFYFGGLKPPQVSYLKGPSPALHINDQTEEWKTMCTQSVSQRSGLSSLQNRESPCVWKPTSSVSTEFTHLTSKACQSGRFGTTISVCMALFWVKQQPDNHSLISWWIFFLTDFVSSSMAEKCWAADQPQFRLRGRKEFLETGTNWRKSFSFSRGTTGHLIFNITSQNITTTSQQQPFSTALIFLDSCNH